MENENSEIAKLTERISKDPKSKLFVPLAEEYKKVGDIEMAVYVLTEGLKNNPGYVTARSFLGKLLLEKGDVGGAQKELEEVIKAVPDNLMAQRKLGDAYALQDRREDALKHYRIALALNPKDEEFAGLVNDLDAGLDIRSKLPYSIKTPSASPAAAKQPAVPATDQEPTGPAPQQPKQSSGRPFTTMPTSSNLYAEQFDGGGGDIAPDSGFAEDEEPEEVLVVEPLDGEQAPTETAVSLPPEAVAAPASAMPGPVEPVADSQEAAGSSAVEEQAAATTWTAETPSSEVPSSAISDELDAVLAEFAADEEPVEEPSPPAADEEPVIPGTATEEALRAASVSALPEKPRESGEGAGEAASTAESDDFTTDTLAELYLSQGFYEKAIEIYERMLAENPGSKGLKAKLERVREVAAQSAEPAALGTPVSHELKAEGGLQPHPEEMATALPEDFLGEDETEKPASSGAPSQKAPEDTREAREYVPPSPEPTVDKASFEIPQERKPAAAFGEENLFAEAREYRPEEVEPKATESAMFDEPREYRPPDVMEPPAVENLFAEAREYKPVVEGPVTEDIGMAAEFELPQAKAESRETIVEATPPQMDVGASQSEKPKGASMQPAVSGAPVAPKAPLSPAKRREAIDRLESWLAVIKKEM